MSTNYHTPIVLNAPGTPATVNAPLSALDSALTATNANTNAVTSEVATGRGGYASLNARFANLVLAGGNVATLTNSAAMELQKIVVVDSSTGFIAGARVAYLLMGETVEYNVIDTIDSPTQFTMITDIGTDGINDNAYISMITESEYQAAQAIPHAESLTLPKAMEYAAGGVCNVMAFGAYNDGTHSAETTAAFQAAIDAAEVVNGVVLGPPGTYSVSTTLLITTRVDIRLDGATIIGPSSGYIFDIGSAPWGASDGTGIIGNGGAVLQVSAGGAGGVLIRAANRVRLWNFAINHSTVSGSKGIHQWGGWYEDFRNIDMMDGASHNLVTAPDYYGLYIQSDEAADATSGSHGSYVSQYSNIYTQRVKIVGKAVNRCTTLYFTNLCAGFVEISYSTIISFIQPVMQNGSTGSMFTLDHCSELTFIAGDFEFSAAGTLYNCGTAVANITSLNNSAFWFAAMGTYLSGTSTGYNLMFDADSSGASHYIDGPTFQMKARLTSDLAVTGSLRSFSLTSAVESRMSASDAATVGYAGTMTAHPFDIYSNSSPRVRHTPDGNVLIGTFTDGMTNGGSVAIAKDLAHRGTKAGFYNTAPAAKPTGVAVTAAGIHAALVTLGLIAA